MLVNGFVILYLSLIFPELFHHHNHLCTISKTSQANLFIINTFICVNSSRRWVIQEMKKQWYGIQQSFLNPQVTGRNAKSVL
jgi:hypothetical protein